MHSTPEGRTQHNDDGVTHTHQAADASREGSLQLMTLLTVADPLDGAHGTLFLHLLTCFHHGSWKEEFVAISFIFI